MTKRKNTVTMIVSLVIAGAVLTGCGQSGQEPQEAAVETAEEMSGDNEVEIPQDTAKELPKEIAEETGQEDSGETEEDAGEDADKTKEGYEDNFAVESKAAKEFAEKIKEAASQKDLEALANLTAFPVYVGLPDAGAVENRDDFIKLGAEMVFTDELVKSIEMSDIENLQPSMAGFSVSDGGPANINFGVVDGRLAVTGINY